MCSSGSCGIGGLIGGPVGNIVEMGIKALVNGAPIGPRSAEAPKKPSEQENIRQFYDNVETHLKGVLQVLEPALEIKKILSGECKSAERERPVGSQLSIRYYSPQNTQKSQESGCPARRSVSGKASRLSADKSSLKAPSPRSSKMERSNEKKSQSKPPSTGCKSSSKKDAPKIRSSSESSYKSCCSSGSGKESSRGSPKNSKSKPRSKSCIVCDVSLKDNIVLAVLPCQHLFCYTCLAEDDGKRCRKCDKNYHMKNVSQIFYRQVHDS